MDIINFFSHVSNKYIKPYNDNSDVPIFYKLFEL